MEHRPFPPSPRRLALARAAGASAASPVVGGAVAWAAALIAVIAAGPAAAAHLGAWIAAACAGRPSLTADASLVGAVAAIIAPPLLAAALAAAVAHVAQTRALWWPRRRIRGAPQLDRGAGTRVARAGRELAGAAVAIAVAIGWLWTMAPRLAALAVLDGAALLAAGGALLASVAAALAIAWVALGAIDALVQHAAHARALAMTATDKRDDDRLAGADPRWRARRAAIGRATSPADAVAGAAVLVLGDDLAIAIAWDPIRRPVPARVAIGRAARATQLLGLARRHRVPVHREVELATALATGDGAVPEALWPRVAELVAAVGRR